MQIKNKSIYLLPSFCIIFCLAFSSITNAKYLFEVAGIAWQSHFTDFAILNDLFEAEPEKIESDNLWTPKDANDNPICKPGTSTPGYGDSSNIATGENYYFLKQDAITKVSEGFLGGSHNELTDETIAIIKGYSLTSLNDMELNVINDTGHRVVISFDMCYYAPKTTETSIGQLYFSVYNSYLYPDTVNDSITNPDENLLYGEIVTNPHDKIEDDGTCWKEVKEGWFGATKAYYIGKEEPRNASYVDALSCRIGSSDQNGFKYNGTDYHCHKAHINPYGIINANKNYFKSPSTLLESFILEDGELQSFNLSMFYNTFGKSDDLSSYPACFFSSLQMTARKIEHTVSFYNNNGTALYDFSVVTNGGSYSNITKLSEGSFFTNFGIPFPDLSFKADGVKISNNPGYSSDWVFYTTGAGTEDSPYKYVDIGTAGATQRDFTYFTKINGDIKVYAKS